MAELSGTVQLPQQHEKSAFTVSLGHGEPLFTIHGGAMEPTISDLLQNESSLACIAPLLKNYNCSKVKAAVERNSFVLLKKSLYGFRNMIFYLPECQVKLLSGSGKELDIMKLQKLRYASSNDEYELEDAYQIHVIQISKDNYYLKCHYQYFKNPFVVSSIFSRIFVKPTPSAKFYLDFTMPDANSAIVTPNVTFEYSVSYHSGLLYIKNVQITGKFVNGSFEVQLALPNSPIFQLADKEIGFYPIGSNYVANAAMTSIFARQCFTLEQVMNKFFNSSAVPAQQASMIVYHLIARARIEWYAVTLEITLLCAPFEKEKIFQLENDNLHAYIVACCHNVQYKIDCATNNVTLVPHSQLVPFKLRGIQRFMDVEICMLASET